MIIDSKDNTENLSNFVILFLFHYGIRVGSINNPSNLFFTSFLSTSTLLKFFIFFEFLQWKELLF